jgi:hypothetical protein
MLCLCGFLITPGEGEGEGWTFAPAAIEPMVAAVSSAVNLFREEPDKWKALQLRGMARDSSWERAAQQYEQVRTSRVLSCLFGGGVFQVDAVDQHHDIYMMPWLSQLPFCSELVVASKVSLACSRAVPAVETWRLGLRTKVR